MKINLDDYRIVRQLAIGGMSEVFLAKKREQITTPNPQYLALKVFQNSLPTTNQSNNKPDFSSFFLNEAKVLAKLRHNNIVRLYDVGLGKQDELYMALEYLPGGDLEDRRKRGINTNSALQVLIEIGNALSALHQTGIVHGDVKPANILFRDDETPMLIDFGIAQKKQQATNKTTTQLGSQQVFISTDYASPEQIQGLALDERSDIYSLGVVLLELLIGSNPFKASTHRQTALNHLHAPLPALEKRQARFQTLLEKMLAKKPQQRFSSVEACMQCLDDILVDRQHLAFTPANATRVISEVPQAMQI